MLTRASRKRSANPAMALGDGAATADSPGCRIDELRIGGERHLEQPASLLLVAGVPGLVVGGDHPIHGGRFYPPCCPRPRAEVAHGRGGFYAKSEGDRGPGALEFSRSRRGRGVLAPPPCSLQRGEVVLVAAAPAGLALQALDRLELLGLATRSRNVLAANLADGPPAGGRHGQTDAEPLYNGSHGDSL
jgi:hypothetical protein